MAIRGGSAGVYMMPEKMNKKLFKQLEILGVYFDKNRSFDIEVLKEMAKPNRLTKSKSTLIHLFSRIGLGDTMFWNMMLKKNKARDRRFDKPFANELSD